MEAVIMDDQLDLCGWAKELREIAALLAGPAAQDYGATTARTRAIVLAAKIEKAAE